MSFGDYLRKNLHFWHWYPRLLCEGLTGEQLHWQPETNQNHIFCIGHTAEHLGEVQYIKGLLGKIGAPL